MNGGDGPWREAYQGARLAWPGVTLDLDRFVAHARQVGFALNAKTGEPDPANLSDLFLACAAGQGDRTAIHVLEEQAIGPARGSVRRLDARPEFVDDVMQELRARLLLPPEPRILKYGGRGPLLAWVRVAATRIAIDNLRAVRDVVGREAADPDALEQVDFGPEVQLLRAAYREAFQEAIAAAIAALAPQDRSLLRRHLI